jgi:hypothetical protein
MFVVSAACHVCGMLVFPTNGLIKKLFIFSRSVSIQNFLVRRSLVKVNCSHLRRLNVQHIGMVGPTGLKITATMSPSMACPSY